MDNFISTIRTDRYREIKKYEEKGYTFIDKGSYRMIEKIETMQESCNFEFGIEVTQSDVYFYLTNKAANVYLSIIDIYNLLIDILKQENLNFVVNLLKKQLKLKIKSKKSEKEKIINQEKFRYKGIEYNIRQTVKVLDDKLIKIPDSSLEITYQNLFMIINLIQEKSNSLFLRGKEKKYKQYVDGILRMYIVLLTKKEDVDILKDIGWNYNVEQDKFLYAEPKIIEERGKRKYYLTNMEYKSIIE